MRDALAARIAKAKQAANPLMVDLDDEPADDGLEGLRAKQREAQARLDKPDHVSADGLTQVIVIRTAFVASDVAKDHALEDQIDAFVARRTYRRRCPGRTVPVGSTESRTGTRA